MAPDSSPPASAGREEEIRARVNAATRDSWGFCDACTTRDHCFLKPDACVHYGGAMCAAPGYTEGREEERETATLSDDERLRLIQHRLAIGYYWAGVEAPLDVTWLRDQLAASRSESSRLREAVERVTKAQLDAVIVASFLKGHWPGLEDGIDWNDDDQIDGSQHPAYQAATRICEAAALSPQPKEGA